MTRGTELPSFGVAFYGAGSIGLLGLVTIFGFFQYLFLGKSFSCVQTIVCFYTCHAMCDTSY